MIRNEFEREMKMIQKKSTSSSQGGWGTFSIVFEDNPKKHHPLVYPGQMHPQPPVKLDLNEKDFPQRRRRSSVDQTETANETQSQRSEEGPANIDQAFTPEQLSHFIEVGLLLDQKSFKHLVTYQEDTFDSKITKYLFELQEPLDNTKALKMQSKLRSQLYENFGVFSEINPIYLSFNLGRNVSPFWNESLSQDHFRLIKRESIYLAGEHYLTVNFLRCDKPSMVIRVIAFDNETCSSYSFDLTYEDIMLFVDGNTRLLDPENQNELCQMIQHNLTKFNSKEAQGNTELLSDGNRSNDGDNEGGGLESKYSRILTPKEGEEEDYMRGGKADITLAVEHKIFFNEAYKQEYERNKVIIAKLDKRKKPMYVQDKLLETDFERAIVYEAHDQVFSETLVLARQSSGESSIRLSVHRGRMSENMILKLQVICQVA